MGVLTGISQISGTPELVGVFNIFLYLRGIKQN